MKRLPRLIAVAAVVTALAACTPTTSSTADTTTTLLRPPRTVLRVGVERWPSCLNPLLCADDALQQQILQHVLPGAYRLDADNNYVPTAVLDGPAEVELIPESGSSADAPSMTITYRLNPEARWADGMPMTSSDFVGTWQAVLTTPGADTDGYELISEIDDRDPLVAVVTLTTPFGNWRELFGGAHNHLLQADAFGATTDLTDSFQTELPFSGGPYQLVSWSENEAVLARTDNEWDPNRSAQIDQVRYRPVAVDDVSPDSFDVLVPAPGSAFPAPEGYESHRVPTTRVVGVWFDRRSTVLQNEAHRRALALALDRTVLAEAAVDAGSIAGPVDCAGWVPGVGPWCAAARADFTHDPAQARSVLEAEGWIPAEDGPLVRDGELLSLTLTSDPADPIGTAVADAVADALARLGITVERAQMPTVDWVGPRSLENSGGVAVYALDVGIGPETPNLYDCPLGVPTSVVAWCPVANADTVAALRTTVDVDRRVELVSTLGERIEDESVAIPLVRLADLIHVRPDRVTAPDMTRAVGGPLASLVRFTVAD